MEKENANTWKGEGERALSVALQSLPECHYQRNNNEKLAQKKCAAIFIATHTLIFLIVFQERSYSLFTDSNPLLLYEHTMHNGVELPLWLLCKARQPDRAKPYAKKGSAPLRPNIPGIYPIAALSNQG